MEKKDEEDKLDDPANDQPLMAHLIELRERTVKAAISVLIVFVAMSPFMKEIFDWLSKPLMVALPDGAKLLSTGVVAPFMVPLKVTLFCAFVVALPYVLYQFWAYIAPALQTRKALGASRDCLERFDVCRRHGVLLLCRLPDGLSVYRRILPGFGEFRARYR